MNYTSLHLPSREEMDQKRDAMNTLNHFKPNERKNHKKKYVEQVFVEMALETTGRVNRALSITGPDVIRHARMYFDHLTNELHVIERNPYVFAFMLSEALKCKEYREGKLRLMQTPAEVCQVKNCRFVDLDLMDSLKTTKDIVIRCLDQQSESVQGPKFFIFTAAIRKSGNGDLRFQQCKEIFGHLGAKLVGFDGIKDTIPPGTNFGRKIVVEPCLVGKHCRQRFPDFVDMGRISKLKFFHYSDGCPMMTVGIAYE